MKLCIPVNGPNGIESLIEPHLPTAEHLLFFDTETRLCEEISLREPSGRAAEDMQIHAVLCGSINRVTLRTLIEQGIAVYGTEAQTAAQAIAQYENGELEAAVVAPAAAGHAHGKDGGCACSQAPGEAAGGEHGCHGDGGCCGGQAHAHDRHGNASGGCCGGHADERPRAG